MPKSSTNRQPTIADVASRAGVSIATVSRVINRTAPVETTTLARVERAMHDLRYTPRTAARSLATRKTQTLGLLLAQMESDFFSPLLAGVESGVREAGYNLLITTSGGRGGLNQLPPSLGPHNTDGLLVFAHTLSDSCLAACYESGYPIVLLHQVPPPGLPIPCVIVENRAAACHLVSHLIQAHGRRHIVLLRGPKANEDSTRREEGSREALELHEVPFDPRLVLLGEFDRNVAFNSVRRLLASGIKFDAIFASGDEMAVGVLAALREASRAVPGEISVVGFDDQRMAAYLTPTLTTVRAPTEQVGQEGVRQLVRIIQGEKPDLVTMLATELILRNSCGCE